MNEPRQPRMAMHRRVAQAIRNDIEAGRLRDGERLPSTRELAEQWDVSVFTINEAMDTLTKEGFVTSKARSGRVVTLPPELRQRIGISEPIRPIRPQVVLVGGWPGSGKSEFSRVLARLTGWALLDKDTIARPIIEPALEDLGSTFDDRESDIYLTKIRPREYEALQDVIRDNIQCGNSCIGSAPYLREFTDRSWIDKVVDRLGQDRADVTFVWVRCTAETMHFYLRRRGAARDRHKLAHWDEYVAGVDVDFRPDVPHIVIDNDPDSEPLQTQARRLLDGLRRAGEQESTV
ncbi:GntR family transcriptional regulator [Nocardia wallacei]|uniref:GntR family transcriptional regulator n=1 Tax=Nocardia wallacei TaxID=480035 RepID=UPI002453A879|nr:GntR family transcriptional regulator [Nocardia wallacei]